MYTLKVYKMDGPFLRCVHEHKYKDFADAHARGREYNLNDPLVMGYKIEDADGNVLEKTGITL